MNLKETLTILSEECAEVIQANSKLIRFGPYDEENIKFYSNKFKDNPIERPSHWIGLRVKPSLIEFWQDMPFRLHDRLEFTIVNGKWKSRKLYP